MNKLSLGAGSGLLGLSAFLVFSPSPVPDDHGRREYDVTLSNLTRSQIFAPALVATHDAGVALFRLNQPASDGLALLAEDGDGSMLQKELEHTSGVEDIESSGANLMPGHSVTVRVRTRGDRDHLSLAAMLVTTNDTFAGLNGLQLDGKDTVVYLTAYDAGSEFNSEDCAKIPGPPCVNPGVRDTANAEGRVYVSNGIHGQGSIDPAVFDWGNPVAMVEIHRVGGHD